MADELYNELLAKGFLPELKFRNDNHTKLLYVKNQSVDSTRISKLGNLNVPVFQLDEQNETLKAVTGGTRVHLAPSDEIIIEEPWTCIGTSTNTAKFYDNWVSGTVRSFTIIVNNGVVGQTFTVTGDNHLDELIKQDPVMGPFVLSERIIVTTDIDNVFTFKNINQDNGYQVEIRQTDGAFDPALLSGDENTSVHKPNVNAVRFCLEPYIPNYTISCDGATDFIHYQINQTNLEDIVVDGVSYGNDLTVFNTDPTLSAIFNADYDVYGILYNISQDPHRVRFVGYNLDFSQIEGSYNTTVMMFEDGNVGVCLGPQQPTGLQPLTFSLQANPILKPYWDRAEMFNGQYFISGQADQYNYNPAMRRSVDGVNWIDVVLPDTVPIYNLVVGPDKILAVGPRGGGYWSSDGINWSKCTFNISRDIYDGIYVNGQYVLVGEYASLFTSTDGISFTALLDGTNLSTHPVFGGGVASYSSISYGNGKYIISGRHGTTNYPQSKNAFFASSNLTSWTVWSDTTTYPNGNLNEPSHQDMIFDGTQFVSIALGTVGSSDVPVFYGVTYTSADGVTWTRTQSLTDYPSRIVWADDAYITSDYTPDIKTSTDLINWTTIYTRTQLSGRRMDGLVYKNNTLLAAGQKNQIILGTRG